MTEIGHNSAAASKDELLSFAQRIERLKDEKAVQTAEFNEAIKEVWAEAKGRGYDAPALKEMLRIRAMPEEKRQMMQFYAEILDVFE